ncbi:MAG: hypothetical protein ABH862_04245 [Candidatus Omnitrophota bacterium]
MFLKFFRTIIGLLFVPVAIGTAKAFGAAISQISFLNGVFHILERGTLVYLLFHVLVARPIYLYVLGHETVHVLATWICGGKIVSFNVTPSGGNVSTSKTNFFIELSPYFVPLYTIIIGIIFAFLRMIDKVPVFLPEMLLFMIGLSLAFHLVMTAEALKIRQPDIVKSGMVFSFVLIFVCNLVVVIAVFAPIFSDISFTNFIRQAYDGSIDVYRDLYARSQYLYAHYLVKQG